MTPLRSFYWVFAVLAFAVPTFAQEESPMAAEFRREREAVAHSCGDLTFGALPACAVTLVTANPLHVTFGSIAPQNGLAVGPAFVGHYTPSETLRLTWSTDVVAAPGGAWRVGAYVNLVPTNVVAPIPVFEGDTSADPGVETYPVYSLYAQAISLDKLSFFGLGPTSTDAARTSWAMRQTIVGGGVLFPLRRTGRFGVALTGGVSGRLVRVGDGDDPDVPGISRLFSANEAPGLGDRRKYLQFTEGVRVNPSAWTYVRPSYRFDFDQYVGGSRRSFSRWTLDLTHEFPFYRTFKSTPRTGNTPNDCSLSLSDHACPSSSRNRYGALSFRILAIGSRARERGAVPFYLQPTLGGADINNAKLLTSFNDYRFRAPNLLAMQLTLEHTLFAVRLPRDITIPLGAFVMAEQGKVGERWNSVGHFKRSYTAGLTIRAGGFPEVFLLFAWGREGSHFSGSVSPALLGGSPRPSLH
ncbi:MAG: hypothetical protein ABL993_03245 [Vicinamibacterales bacterium]